MLVRWHANAAAAAADPAYGFNPGNDPYKNNFAFPPQGGPPMNAPQGWQSGPPPQDWQQQQPPPRQQQQRSRPRRELQMNSDGNYIGPGTSGYLSKQKKKGDSIEVGEDAFDFQQSNARFDKDQYLNTLSKAKETPEGEDADEGDEGETAAEDSEIAALGLEMEKLAKIKPCYDSKKSFFDEISTDRDTRSPYNRNAEKSTNVETFGSVAETYRSYDFRRDGRRGRGGRRGGRNYNNNRQWNNNDNQGGNNNNNGSGYYNNNNRHWNNNNNSEGGGRGRRRNNWRKNNNNNNNNNNDNKPTNTSDGK